MSYNWTVFNGSGGDKYVTVDKFGRLYMSSDLATDLGCKGLPFQAHVAYDATSDSLGLARPGTVNVTGSYAPATFDGKRRYASLRKFLGQFGLVTSDMEPIKYVFIEKSNGWYVFRPADKEGVMRS